MQLMNSFARVFLIIFALLFFVALYTFLLYSISERLFSTTEEDQFTVIFIFLIAFSMTFFQLYHVNKWFEKKYNKPNQTEELFFNK